MTSHVNVNVKNNQVIAMQTKSSMQIHACVDVIYQVLNNVLQKNRCVLYQLKACDVANSDCRAGTDFILADQLQHVKHVKSELWPLGRFFLF